MSTLRLFRPLLIVPLAAISVGLLLVSCDQKPVAPKKKVVKESKPSPEVRFQEARSLMVDGKFNDAAKILAEVSAEPKVRQPLLNWVDFLQGVSLMFAGKEDEAQAVFGKIETRGPFTRAGTDAPVAGWFVTVAKELHTKDPVAPTTGKDFDKWSYEGIAMLAFALKDWNLEKFDDATALFRQFADVQPEKMVDWADGPKDLAKLKEMGDNMVNDYKEFDPANKALDAATTPEDQATAVEAAKAARAKMKLTTKMSETLDAKIADIGPKAQATLMAMAKAKSEELDADTKAMTDAKTKRKELMDKFMFAEAKNAIADANVKLEKSKDEQEVLTKKTSWLANFKSQLVEDLQKKGYKQPVTLKSGGKAPGAVAKADNDNLILNTGATVPWGDVSLDSAYEMGLSFIEPDMPPDITAFRKWHLGTFAFYAGKKKEGLELLKRAADFRSVFKDELPLFEGAAGEGAY
jgi:hypothetical protein